MSCIHLKSSRPLVWGKIIIDKNLVNFFKTIGNCNLDKLFLSIIFLARIIKRQFPSILIISKAKRGTNSRSSFSAISLEADPLCISKKFCQPTHKTLYAREARSKSDACSQNTWTQQGHQKLAICENYLVHTFGIGKMIQPCQFITKSTPFILRWRWIECHFQ